MKEANLFLFLLLQVSGKYLFNQSIYCIPAEPGIGKFQPFRRFNDVSRLCLWDVYARDGKLPYWTYIYTSYNSS